MDQKQTIDDLRREVGRIAAGHGQWQDVTQGRDWRAYTPAPADVRLKPQAASAAPADRGPFGKWLLGQVDRGGFIGQLATIAATDRGFPKNGDPEAVRKRLGDVGADPEMFEAVDEAELDWASY